MGRGKKGISSLRQIKKMITDAKLEMEVAERAGELNRASELKYGELPKLEKHIKTEEEKLSNESGNRLLKEEVDENDIAKVVSIWTGVPVTKLLTGERQKLIYLKEELSKRVVGQDEAIAAVNEAVIRARAGIKDPNRPIGSFIFLGPTGVVKTELAKTLAQQLFDSERAIIRLDMSEYMEKHSLARLIGAPPGYIGYEEEGQLTKAVRRKPYSVVLFDEIEKAHSDIFNILLQILDEGRLTDNKGRVVDLKNTVIIMTSNLGSQEILNSLNWENTKITVFNLLKIYFRPEFINRVDEIIIFKALLIEQIMQISAILLTQLKNRLKHQVAVSLIWDDKVLEIIAKKGYDPQFGARPLKRLIQKALETEISKKIVTGELKEGMRVFLTTAREKIILKLK